MNDNEALSELKAIFSSWDNKPVLFVGSGISKRYRSIPTWKAFLGDIAHHIEPNVRYPYQRFANGIEGDENLVLQSVASKMAVVYRKKFFEENIDSELFTQYSKEISEGSIDVFNLLVTEKIKSFTDNDTFQLEKEDFLKIKDFVSNIITTNFDTFLEEHLGMIPFIGQEEMLNSRTYMINEIYKIHGSVTKPNSIILTGEQYSNYQSKIKYLSAKLLSIFIEYPVIFLGYSITDSDISVILEDVKECLNVEQLNDMPKRIIFIEYSERDDIQIIHYSIKNIPMLKITLKNFTILYKAMTTIKNRFSVKMLRQIQDALAKFIYSDKDEGVIAKVTFLASMDENDVGILIGNNNSILENGYTGLSPDDIIEAIIYDKDYSPRFVIEKTILLNKQRFSSFRFFPLNGYIRKINSTTANQYQPDPFISRLILKDLKNKTIFTEAETRQLKNKQLPSGVTIPQIENLVANNSIKTVEYVFLNYTLFSKDELHDFLKKFWKLVPKENRTIIRKLATIYDYL